MKKNKILVLVLIVVFMISGCSRMTEPNDLAYVVALGIDKSDIENCYDITIQFAKPISISGGSDEGGGGGSGKGIIENLTFTAPTIYSAINIANQLVSKRFTLSHAKKIVFSKYFAEEGIRDFMETIVRNMEMRPNIYMAVSLSKAQEYLTDVQPLIENNPSRYYQLVYENNYSVYTPNNVSQEFYFSQNSMESENVLPIANIVSDIGKDEGKLSQGSSEGSSDSGSSGGEGQSSEGGEQSSEKNNIVTAPSASPLPMDQYGFEYNVRNYIAGDIQSRSKNKSETLGMAIFNDDKMVGIMGSVESQLYNLMKGSFYSMYASFENLYEDKKSSTVRIEQAKKPKIKVDISGDKPKIKVDLFLSGEFYSLPADFIVEKDIETYENNVTINTEEAAKKFLYKTSKEFETDIMGFGSYAKRNFLTYKDFIDYNWKEKYPDSEFEIHVDFKIRRSGLTIRTGEE